MAADFAVQQHPPFNTSPHNHYNMFGANNLMNKPQSTSPQQNQLLPLLSPSSSSPSTPHNASPDSSRAQLASPYSTTGQMTPGAGAAAAAAHHLPLQARQLRPPKSPLYVPAVLRPNEFPPASRRIQKPSPPSPPHSLDDRSSLSGSTEALKRRSTADSGKFAFGFGGFSSSASSGSQTPREEAIESESWGKVSSLPTRQHWKPDSDSSICDETTCTKYFSYFTRRHHCRRCGNIFCDDHSRYAVPLDQDANFHPQGTSSRACSFCYSEYKSWDLARWSRSNSASSTRSPEAPSTPSAIGTPPQSAANIALLGPKKDGTPESLAASVPRDWNWSTF